MLNRKPKKVLILGGCGFIGSHVVDCFVAGGHDVRVIDRQPERFREEVPGVEYLFGDFGKPTELAAALQEREIVVHLVSTTIPKTSNEDPIFDIQSNLVATVSCLQQCVEARIQKVVFISSGGALYGNPEHCPISESSITHPICSYGIVKGAIEKYLDLFRSMFGLESVALRVGNPYGPRQDPERGQGVVAAFLARIAAKKPIEIWGSGSVVRDYFYVEDLARAVYSAAFSECRFHEYNVGSGVGLSVLELLSCISSTLAISPEIRFLEGRSFDVSRVYLDISRIKDDLEWMPAVPLEDGIRRTWDFVRGLQG
jgi:UDP-glucose 4-epimerase